MLWKVRSAIRRRFVDAAREGVDASDLRTQADRLATQVDALARRIDEIEHRQRRDLDYAGQIQSAHESSEFVLAEMPTAPRFPHKYETLRHGLALADPDGLALEFGVAAGHTLRIITEHRPAGTVFGFDSYEGFPEDWRTGFPKGSFAMEPPEIPGARIVQGWFEETLPAFLAAHPEPIAFVHADGDLYSSTRTILDNLEHRLLPGTVIVFDEFFNYPGWRDHEYRAWAEFVRRTGLAFRYEGYSADDEQVVVRVLEPPRGSTAPA